MRLGCRQPLGLNISQLPCQGSCRQMFEGLGCLQDIDKAKASGLDASKSVTLVNGDVTSGVEYAAAECSMHGMSELEQSHTSRYLQRLGQPTRHILHPVCASVPSARPKLTQD